MNFLTDEEFDTLLNERIKSALDNTQLPRQIRNMVEQTFRGMAQRVDHQSTMIQELDKRVDALQNQLQEARQAYADMAELHPNAHAALTAKRLLGGRK